MNRQAVSTSAEKTMVTENVAVLAEMIIFAHEPIKDKKMTAVQLNALNAQIWRDMGIIAENESMMKRVAKFRL